MVSASIKSYCQFLLSTQTNYTITYFTDHVPGLSHDKVTRLLKSRHITPKIVWQAASQELEQVSSGFILFDDTVLDKDYSFAIEGVKKQYSGNAHGLIKGIGLVNCVYYNPELKEFSIIDYRIYDPETDGKTKIDHVKDMLYVLHHQRKLLFSTVLMDSWYATHYLMLYISRLEKYFYCPLKENRLVDDSLGERKYTRVDKLIWSPDEEQNGKTIKIKKFPKDFRVKLFRVKRKKQMEYIVTNNISDDSSDHADKICKIRWHIEEFHRELKQNTGLEACQCRKRRSQRNHIACSMLVWLRLKSIAKQTKTTIYQLKQSLLDNYLRHELVSPILKFA